MSEKHEVIQHFVEFYSPGTFVAESTVKPIESWDTQKACAMAKKIQERHGATPYGFRFSTRGRLAGELDSKEIKHSNMYYLGGEIFTLKDIKKRNDPNDRLLISNMEINKYDRVIQNDNSWRWTMVFNEGDVVLPFQTKTIPQIKCDRNYSR